MKKQQGFNLIELMVVVTIIGIIASVAIPSYQKSVVKTNRGEGTTALESVMHSQLEYMVNDRTYTVDLTDLSYSNPYLTPSGNYSITASTCNSTTPIVSCVKLTAQAKKGQVSDGDLTLDSIGNRTRKGNDGWLN